MKDHNHHIACECRIHISASNVAEHHHDHDVEIMSSHISATTTPRDQFE